MQMDADIAKVREALLWAGHEECGDECPVHREWAEADKSLDRLAARISELEAALKEAKSTTMDAAIEAVMTTSPFLRHDVLVELHHMRAALQAEENADGR
jgi:hypothetical protein